MRRLILEFDVGLVSGLTKEPALKRIESMEVLSFLEDTPERIALIFKVKFNDPNTRVADVFAKSFDEVQVLEKGKDGYICYSRGPRSANHPRTDPLGPGVYLTLPYEISAGRLRAAFLANAKEAKGILKRLREASLPYKVVSFTDAKFSPDSPLGRLTEKQRRVLESAFRLGYYDVPRRVSSEELAKQLRIREPTLVIHRRKAEKRLLSAIF